MTDSNANGWPSYFINGSIASFDNDGGNGFRNYWQRTTDLARAGKTAILFDGVEDSYAGGDRVTNDVFPLTNKRPDYRHAGRTSLTVLYGDSHAASVTDGLISSKDNTADDAPPSRPITSTADEQAWSYFWIGDPNDFERY